MNGPDNYAAAERLLKAASSEGLDSAQERYCLGAAQVHATLALAAATMEAPLQHRNYDVAEAWNSAVHS